jgi:hypothetical protein
VNDTFHGWGDKTMPFAPNIDLGEACFPIFVIHEGDASRSTYKQAELLQAEDKFNHHDKSKI